MRTLLVSLILLSSLMLAPAGVSASPTQGEILSGHDIALDATDGRILWRPHVAHLIDTHESPSGNSLAGATPIQITDTEITGVLWVEHPVKDFAIFLGGSDPGTCDWTDPPSGTYPPCIGWGNVYNDGEGNLTGTITTPEGTTDVSTLRIDEHGYFHGTLLLNGTHPYRMNCQDDFSCQEYEFRVQTDWLPVSRRASFVGTVIISDPEIEAPTPKYYVVFTPSAAIPTNGTLVFTFPPVYADAFALLEAEDIALSGGSLVNTNIQLDYAKRQIIIETETTGMITEEMTLVIGDGQPGGFQDLSNPLIAGLYGIGINIFDATDTEVNTGIAYARISNSDVQVTASIMEALTVTINSSSIHFTLNPSVDNGQDRTQYTSFSIGTNSPLGYVIYAKLDDGNGVNQLRSSTGGTIPSGFGENTLSYEAMNTTYDPEHEVAGNTTFATNATVMTAGVDTLGNPSGGNNQEHTIYYHVDTDYLTPPGQYAATLTYTITPGF